MSLSECKVSRRMNVYKSERFLEDEPRRVKSVQEDKPARVKGVQEDEQVRVKGVHKDEPVRVKCVMSVSL